MLNLSYDQKSDGSVLVVHKDRIIQTLPNYRATVHFRSGLDVELTRMVGQCLGMTLTLTPLNYDEHVLLGIHTAGKLWEECGVVIEEANDFSGDVEITYYATTDTVELPEGSELDNVFYLTNYLLTQ